MSRWGAPWWSVLVALVAATALGTTPVAAHADTADDADGGAGDGPSRVLPDDDVDGHPAEVYEIWYSDDGWDVGVGQADWAT